MAKRYDAVVIGGGHNGLVNAAYLAKAGLKVLVLERRHLLGGATLTEEIVPGFRFSVFSYVVSLLRPEIIRELELPKHGLEILPLDGTITPLDDDYLWRVNDHGKTVRELRRWSLNDAEAYEEYGPLMAEMGRFIKPILSVPPPDPGKISPMEWLPLTPLAKQFRDLPRRMQTDVHPADDDVGGGLPRSVVRDRAAEGDDERVAGSSAPSRARARPGTAYVLLHHYMGEIDGAFRAWGVPKGGTGAIAYAIADAALVARRRDPHRGAGRPDQDHRLGKATGVMLESGEEIEADVVMSSLDSRWTFIKLLEDGVLDPAFRDEVLRYKYRGSSGKVNLALDGLPGARVQAGHGGVAPRRDLVLARRSTTSSTPTTTRSTAGRRRARTSTASCRRSSTRRWRRPAST